MNIWHKIESLLKNNINLYLLTVVESKGSAPGRRGFKMVVSENGELFGSIGGGVMEFNMVEKAKGLFKNKTIQQYWFKQDHRVKSEVSSGMICSGSQSIAFNYLTRDDLMLVASCKQAPVMIELSDKGIKSIDVNEKEYFIKKFIDTWSYTELINQSDTVHIFGAGHVSVPTTELLSKLDFQVFLYDNRCNINTFTENNNVFSKKIIDYENILNGIKINQRDYVLLMTHKFIEDKLILSQLLPIKIKYLGVLGSKNKIKTMFEQFLKEGVGQQVLDDIHAPIGLNINSKTTQEIAVSIVAEIIKEKNS